MGCHGVHLLVGWPGFISPSGMLIGTGHRGRTVRHRPGAPAGAIGRLSRALYLRGPPSGQELRLLCAEARVGPAPSATIYQTSYSAVDNVVPDPLSTAMGMSIVFGQAR